MSMKQAYEAGSKAFREKLAREAPADEALLRQMRESDTIVVRGTYDFAEDVLSAMQVPFVLVEPGLLAQTTLRPEQAVLVNCPGQIERAGLDQLRRFVETGGYLVTTDWALKHVLESAFPGFVEYNGRPSCDDVVRVEVVDRGVEMLKDLLDSKDDPQWWLEGSSYPIRVLDPGKVEVLIRSKEMEEKYGEAPIAVRFSCGKGSVFHIVSHYYLQRTETRTNRQKGAAKEYLAEKGIVAAQAAAEGLEAGAVESAYTSTGFLGKILIKRQQSKA
ncbi:MAG: hypothetical protein HYY17_01600 [Planctomycetes bacterium]|nr:hypothetical protein [Planctomycetota bacterium]